MPLPVYQMLNYACNFKVALYLVKYENFYKEMFFFVYYYLIDEIGPQRNNKEDIACSKVFPIVKLKV